MAQLAPTQLEKLYHRPGPVRLALYAVKGVSTDDTADLTGEYRTVELAAFLPVSGGLVASLPAVVGTVVNFDQAGLTAEGGWLLVLGVER